MVKKLILTCLAILLAGSSTGCITFKPLLSEHKLHLGEIHANKRQYEKAESALIRAILYNPENIEAWITLGDIYFTIENYEAARYMYRAVKGEGRHAFKAYPGLWKVRLEESGYSEEVRREVKREIEETLSRGDKDMDRLMAAYYGLQFLHEDEKAMEVARLIMNSGPDRDTIANLSRDTSEFLLIEKDMEKRLKMAEDFLRIFPNSKERYIVQSIRLKILAKDLKDYERLYQYGEEWIRDEPENRRANFLVGYYYTEEGIALEKAILYLKRALQLIEDPDPADKPEYYPEGEWQKDLRKAKGTYYDTLGWAYYKLGRYAEAERAYRSALDHLDWDQNLYYHMGLLNEDKGKIEEAIQFYIRALKSGENREAEERLTHLISNFTIQNRYGTTPVDTPDIVSSPPGEGSYKIGEPLHRSFARREGITTFTDVTVEAGLSGAKGLRVAWGDYNNDGYEDILLDGHRLFRNMEGGGFIEVTKEAGITEISGAKGGIWGDFDNDGYLDFYTFASGRGNMDRIWKNNGDGSFTDITGVAMKTPDSDPSEAASLGDYDNDGFLDIYVANYEKPLSQTVERGICRPDRLFHNNGDGTFTDVSTQAGIVSLENMCGRGVSWGDYDNDGDLDIYVSNYRLDPNFLWRNNGNGTFTNVAKEAGVEGSEEEGAYGHTIGAEWGDINADGYLDLFVSNLAHPRYIGFSDKSMLLINQGPPDFKFIDKFSKSGIRFEETSADPSLADYDNDGILDLYFTSTYEGRKSFLYRGKGDGTFTDVTWLAGVRVDNGWGNAFADYDNDGDLDLLVGSPDGVRLFRNDGNNHHWIHIKVVGRESNRAGIGTKVTVTHAPSYREGRGCAKGDCNKSGMYISPRQIREVQGGKGSGSEHSLPVEFGLGDYGGPVDIEVRFPSGKVVQLQNIKPDRLVVVEE